METFSRHISSVAWCLFFPSREIPPFARLRYHMGRNSGIYYNSALSALPTRFTSTIPDHIGHIQGGRSETYQHSVLWTFDHNSTCDHCYAPPLNVRHHQYHGPLHTTGPLGCGSLLYCFLFSTTALLLDCIGKQHVRRHAGRSVHLSCGTRKVARSNA